MKPKKPKVPGGARGGAAIAPHRSCRRGPASSCRARRRSPKMLQRSLLQYQREFEAGDPLAWLRGGRLPALSTAGRIPPWARLKFFTGVY